MGKFHEHLKPGICELCVLERTLSDALTEWDSATAAFAVAERQRTDAEHALITTRKHYWAAKRAVDDFVKGD